MRHSSLLALAAQNLVLLSACGASPASVQGDVASTSQSCTAPAAPSEGYKLVRDGKLVRRERTWTRSQGVANCKRNINRHTQERVACYFDAKPLGYELLMDGARVGYEPGWTRSQGVANCEQTFNQAPQTSVACYYDGTRLGYELFWDGTRVDYEPGWTRSQGVTNCEWNVHQFPQKNVECDYEGSRLGYELFWDGERVRHEPGWSESRAIRNCARSRRTYSADLQLARPGAWLKCLYDGVPVFQPIPSPTCGGVPTYIVRTESGLCQRVAGWDTPKRIVYLRALCLSVLPWAAFGREPVRPDGDQLESMGMGQPESQSPRARGMRPQPPHLFLLPAVSTQPGRRLRSERDEGVL
ncbi:MAG: hypothetical protein MUF54_25315 [Polyangiaceae bacterium]|nr:hypothetical protein [Polyangiaceae bacterium]